MTRYVERELAAYLRCGALRPPLRARAMPIKKLINFKSDFEKCRQFTYPSQPT